MATNILMPALSPTMTEGTLARWLKKEGEQVRAGDVIAEIETDKATMEVEAVDEGMLGKILVPDGTANVKVNAPIAVLVADGESADAAQAPAAAAPPTSPPPAPAPPTASAPAQAPVETASGGPAPARGNGHDVRGNGHDTSARTGGERSSPRRWPAAWPSRPGSSSRASRAAARTGASSAPTSRPPAAAPSRERRPRRRSRKHPRRSPSPPRRARPAGAEAHRHRRRTDLVPNTTMRRVISRRLLESHQQVPFFFVTLDIETRRAAETARRAERARRRRRGRGRSSCRSTTWSSRPRRPPCAGSRRLNASYTEENMILYDDVDISVAVSLPDRARSRRSSAAPTARGWRRSATR